MTLEDSFIDFRLLAKTQEYYDLRGFCPTQVPWIVDVPISMITTPKKSAAFSAGSKPPQHLVGSAEQGFLQLALANKLAPATRFQATTPCFRRDVVDASHSRYFMKLELFIYFNSPIDVIYSVDAEYEYMSRHAMGYFEKLTNLNIPKWNRLGDEMCDIEINDIEVGSYGIRSYKNITWVYGTGIALPRFNYAVSLGS